MRTLEHRDDDLVDLGAVKVETHGSAPMGREDVQTGEKFILGGIQSDD